MKINSKWTQLLANWDGKNYVNYREQPLPDRQLTLKIESRPNWKGEVKQVLLFEGGPTGYESYYVESLLNFKDLGETFCICGGTVNSWPRCTVSTADVIKFLKENT